MEPRPAQDPLIVRSGRWLTKRRGILLAPLFAVTLLAARWSPFPWAEWLQDAVGALCLLAGTRLRLVAASYHESSHRSEPITAGPYAWVRHPLYLSNFLLGLGIVLVAGWWPMTAFYTAFYIPLHFVIARSEEVHLISYYGQKYADYLQAVPALLPWRRYRGPRYGSRSRFKLKKGKEGLKAAGYLAGMAALLLVKEIRRHVSFAPPHPLSRWAWLALSAGALWMVVVRTKTKSSLLRASQTVLAVAAVVALAVHVPGLLPLRPGAPAGRTPVPVEEAPAAPALPAARAGASSPGAPPLAIFSPAPPPPRLPMLAKRLMEYVEVVGGASTFGVAVLMDMGEEKEGAKLDHELGEAGRAALIVALALSLWKQWQHPSSALGPSDENAWRVDFRPMVEEDGVGAVAVWKRRF